MKIADLLAWIRPKPTEMEDILARVALAELKPGTTYLMVFEKGALPEAVFGRIAVAFTHHGLKPPIIIRKSFGEFKLYRLEEE